MQPVTFLQGALEQHTVTPEDQGASQLQDTLDLYK